MLSCKLMFHLILLVLTGGSILVSCSSLNTDETLARDLMNTYDKVACDRKALLMEVLWKYETNVTDWNKNIAQGTVVAFGKFCKEYWESFWTYDWKNFHDRELYRKYKLASVLGMPVLEEKDYRDVIKIQNEMENIQQSATVCSYHNPLECHHGYDYIVNTFDKERSEPVLRHTWIQWHDAVGRKVRPLYVRYIRHANNAAILNHFNDYSDIVLNSFETDAFEEDLHYLWEQLRPLYLQLHAYVRRKLINVYGEDLVSADGYIPAHLLGMWSTTWTDINHIVNPFPHIKDNNITAEMLEKDITVAKMYKMAEDFFVSLGFDRMTRVFWKSSLLEKPANREVLCHGNAWDMFRNRDYRIKKCSVVNMHDLFIIHHELGHVQYFMQYSNQSFLFRNGANPGFHEAIGDVVMLSVRTPSYLHKVGLLPELRSGKEEDLAYLFAAALHHIPLMTYAYFFDTWQWKFYRGEISEQELNLKWWEIRKQYQGITYPEPRTEEDFDPGIIYQLGIRAEIITYFVAQVIEFQFHKSLCKEARQYMPRNPLMPLHKCDISGSKEAGKLLKDMLQLGASRPWPEAMSVITKRETDKMDASAVLEYFQPLLEFLEKENSKNNEFIGWKAKSLSSSLSTSHVVYLIWMCALLALLMNDYMDFTRLLLLVLVYPVKVQTHILM